MKYTKLCVVTSLLLFTSTVFAQTQHLSVTRPLEQLPALTNLNPITATITGDAAGAESILTALPIRSATRTLLAAVGANDSPFEDKDFYCVIHILRWSDKAGDGSQTVQTQNWYLYNHHKLVLAKPGEMPRIFGAKNLTLLYLHLNKDKDYQPLYELEVKKKTPAYISHLLGVAELFRSPAAAANLIPRGLAAAPVDGWAADSMTLDYKVSDITITPKVTRPTGTIEEAGVVQKFDNEGLYLADFSVGVPVRKLSQLTFDSTNNTVTAKEVDKTDILAFVNLYPRPVDIKSNNVNLIPHFVGGVAIAKQPLHKIFVGTGFGPVVANFYIGALFVKQEQLTNLKPGDPATPSQLSTDLRRRYKAKFAFGLNVPVGAIVEKLKGK